MTPETPPNPPRQPTDSETIELLIEAQRGLMVAMMHITMAIEEVNNQRPHVADARIETANAAIGKAIEMNTDFLLYARRSSEQLLQRIAPEKHEQFAGPY